MKSSASGGSAVIGDMLVTIYEEGWLIVSILLRVHCEGGGTVVIVPVLIAMEPGAERLEETAIRFDDAGMDKLSPEEIEIGFWWFSLSGECPSRGAIRSARTL